VLQSKQFDLLRHGKPNLTGVYLGRTDTELSLEGQMESEAALERNLGWDLVVCSPLSRCLKTGLWVAQKYDLELLVLDELQEFDFGDWDGQRFEDVYQNEAEKADLFWKDPVSYPPPNGESLESFVERIDRAKSLLLERVEKKVLVVTHGGVIRCLLGEFLGVKPEHWSRIKVDYSHMTQLRFDYNAEQYWPQLLSSNCKTFL